MLLFLCRSLEPRQLHWERNWVWRSGFKARIFSLLCTQFRRKHMYNIKEILETTRMITENNLDVRTITMGISLRDCAHEDVKVCADKIYDKITKTAEHLVKTGQDLEAELGVPIIHKRISVTPISLVGESCKTDSYVPLAKALDKAAKEVGVNFIGG